MPSGVVKLYSVFFKFLFKHRLQDRIQNPLHETNNNNNNNNNTFAVSTRPDESIAAVIPSFTGGVATKDIHIDPFTSLSIRIFLPDTCLVPRDWQSKPSVRASNRSDPDFGSSPNQDPNNHNLLRRNSYGSSDNSTLINRTEVTNRRNSYGFTTDDSNLRPETGSYRSYSPSTENCRKLPVVLQFHGGGFVSGSSDSVANDFFCRRIAKLCDVIVLAIGYRLAPENRYPAAFEDGVKVLHWLAKQANLAECSKSLGNVRGIGADVQRHIADAFGGINGGTLVGCSRGSFQMCSFGGKLWCKYC